MHCSCKGIEYLNILISYYRILQTDFNCYKAFVMLQYKVIH